MLYGLHAGYKQDPDKVRAMCMGSWLSFKHQICEFSLKGIPKFKIMIAVFLVSSCFVYANIKSQTLRTLRCITYRPVFIKLQHSIVFVIFVLRATKIVFLINSFVSGSSCDFSDGSEF